jgi:hypothetical protein
MISTEAIFASFPKLLKINQFLPSPDPASNFTEIPETSMLSITCRKCHFRHVALRPAERDNQAPTSP